MPLEFLHGCPLSPQDLERIRREIEAFDDIGAVDDEIRGIVARNFTCCPSFCQKTNESRGDAVCWRDGRSDQRRASQAAGFAAMLIAAGVLIGGWAGLALLSSWGASFPPNFRSRGKAN